MSCMYEKCKLTLLTRTATVVHFTKRYKYLKSLHTLSKITKTAVYELNIGTKTAAYEFNFGTKTA